MSSDVLIIDSQHSKVLFEVKKLGFLTIRGSLSDFTGEITFNKDTLKQANFSVGISPETIDTGSAKRDEHLKSQDFFHIKKYPEISFQSTSVKSDKNGYQAIGNLSMLGTTKEISIPFSISDREYIGNFKLNRLDYSLGKKFPAFIVGKEIQISIKCNIK